MSAIIYFLAGDEQLCLRMLGETLNLVDMEVSQQRYSHETAREDTQERNRPVGAVLVAKCNLVFRLDTIYFIYETESLYAFKYVFV